MVKSRLDALIAYCALNMPQTFNSLLELYTLTLNLKPLVGHINEFYKGYVKESMLVTLHSIDEQEKHFAMAETFATHGN